MKRLALGIVLATSGLFGSSVTAQMTLFDGTLRQTTSQAAAQQKTPNPETIDQQIQTLTEGLQKAEDSLRTQRSKLQAFEKQSHPDTELIKDTTQIVALIVSRYKHAIDGLRSTHRLAIELVQTQQKLKDWKPPANGPPWPLQTGDDTYLAMTESEVLIKKYQQHELMLRKSRDALLSEKQRLESHVRQLQSPSITAVSGLTERQRLTIDRAQANLTAVDLEFLFADVFLQSNRLNESIARTTHDISSKDWKFMAGRFYFDEPAYKRVIDLIDHQIAHAQQEQEKIRTQSLELIEQYERATERFRLAQNASPVNESELLAANRNMILAADRSKLERMERDVSFYKLEMLQVSKKLWEIRYDLYKGKQDRSDLNGLNEVYGNLDEQLNQWQEYINAQIEQMRKERQAFLDGATLSPTQSEGDFLRERARLMQKRIDTDALSLTQIESTQFLLAITLQELARFRNEANLWDRLLMTLDSTADVAREIWHYELFSISDTVIVEGRTITTQRSVTIGKSIGALMILILGSWLVKRIVSRAMQFALRRNKLRASTSVIISRWITLFAGLSLIVFSLILVDIPLSIFAFAGGALAIGIGFGAQNLLQNLISGLMLLIEKPVRVGDWIEVGGMTGTVTSIGIRFSTLLSPTGTENLVPNSVLVQEKLVNWTYSSPEVRREIEVWVDYQNDPKTVSNVLIAVVQDNPVVLKTPAPRVLLASFTERGMLLKLQFWAPMVPNISGPVIMSEIRMEIHSRFAKLGISFAYPHQTITVQADSTVLNHLRNDATKN